MTRYFVENYFEEDGYYKPLIIVEDKDIDIKTELSGYAYVLKDDINDITAYSVEQEDGDFTMDIKEAEDYIFLEIGELTTDEVDYINYEYLPEITEEEGLTEEVCEKRIIEKMKAKGITSENFSTFESYSYWDGSNWKEEYLNHWYYDVEWIEITEKLEGMEEIDYLKEDFSSSTLYKLKDDSFIIISRSFYQGSLWSINFIDDKDIDNIKDAVKYVNKKESQYY